MTTETTITFKAPLAEVWKGLTDPAIVKQYFFGTNLSSDWMVGSPIKFTGEWEGISYEDGGIILDIYVPKFLKYSYWSSMNGTENRPENYNNITYELDECCDKTILVITQEGIKNQEAADHSEEMWISVFNGLKKIIEK
ncbi:SRPBCC family protein [Mucilaginibacter sp. L3T2-6]|uniref:SRPBCC family protein n=1 Tax=Mucilaginibacter sp. L3T2-6 TaxID=3062491 RepID=UPI002675FA37|nr:SRPBCC family protein [Mucilaginibacter sp. L3T2-6]MDO3645170.1 SRPBCC family protein [Mucilaginibacter sp. L3T2-6]MDV6217630.1 SRPBCC family protein [Mucilaginibacter sp. L3T2-6]